MSILIPKNIYTKYIYIKDSTYTYRIQYIQNNIKIIGIPIKLTHCNVISNLRYICLFSKDFENIKYIDKYFLKNIPNYVSFIKYKYNNYCIYLVNNIYTKPFIDKEDFSCYIYIKYIKKNIKNIPIIHIINGT